MRTNIVLDDNLVNKALKISGASTKKELITVVLKEFIQNHSRLDIRDLKGKLSFRDDYDYKKLRKRSN
ncbi:MAG: type II toxin-antitoxin system VapB family antitoxin [Candidatus Scalindua sp.]